MEKDKILEHASKDVVLQSKCRYCGKVIYSMYKGQLDYNSKAHEISCKMRRENKK